MKKYDVIIVGCGASGLCAARAELARGRRVLIMDMGDKPARKVAVSGGGRCNFTNMAVSVNRYFGNNPDFVRSALAKTTPNDILDWVRKHKIEFTEKAPGQFFCKTESADIVSALIQDANRAEMIFNSNIINIDKNDEVFIVYTTDNSYSGDSVIIATGGISYPLLGVSDFGYKIAKKFGHKIIPPCPALCPIKTNAIPSDFAGTSMPVKIKIGKNIISDNLLFTHFGIGGPAAYRASLYEIGDGVCINFLPNIDTYNWLVESKKTDGKKSLQTILAGEMTRSLAKWFSYGFDKNIADISNKEIMNISQRISNFFIPGNDLVRSGMTQAEVTKGGISTEFVSSKTMESKLCSGLYFIGESLDIAGDLGGFNLHFAFASGLLAGNYA